VFQELTVKWGPNSIYHLIPTILYPDQLAVVFPITAKLMLTRSKYSWIPENFTVSLSESMSLERVAG
jgi:hypothetical protein